VKSQIYLSFSETEVTSPKEKLRKVESKTKEFILFFAETEYVRDFCRKKTWEAQNNLRL